MSGRLSVGTALASSDIFARLEEQLGQEGRLALMVFLLTAVAVTVVLLWLQRKHLKEDGPLDGMEGHDFEHYCAEVLREWGFVDVQVTKGSGDFGADILAEKDGISYAIQCKSYDRPVGVHAVQEIYAGRDYYGRMVGAVMTNQYFTEPAVRMAAKLHILLWDRGYIEGG